jgi:hypothetical protein
VAIGRRLTKVHITSRQVDSASLDLSIQKVGVRPKHDCSGREYPRKGNRGRATPTSASSCRSTARGNLAASRLQPWKDVLDVVAARAVGVVDVHVLFASGSRLIGLLAKVADLVAIVIVVVVVVVVVVVAARVQARKAIAGRDDSFLRIWKVYAVQVRPKTVVGAVDTTLVIEYSKMDRFAVLGRAIGPDVVASIETVGISVLVAVAVVVLILHRCKKQDERDVS